MKKEQNNSTCVKYERSINSGKFCLTTSLVKDPLTQLSRGEVWTCVLVRYSRWAIHLVGGTLPSKYTEREKQFVLSVYLWQGKVTPTLSLIVKPILSVWLHTLFVTSHPS